MPACIESITVPCMSTHRGWPAIGRITCLTSTSAGQSAKVVDPVVGSELSVALARLFLVHIVASNWVLAKVQLVAVLAGVRAALGMTVLFIGKEKTRRSEGRPAS